MNRARREHDDSSPVPTAVAVVASALTLVAGLRQSDYPTVLGRYSYFYAIFLATSLAGVLIAWWIAVDPGRSRRLSRRLKPVPWLALGIAVASTIAALALTMLEVDTTLGFLSRNQHVLLIGSVATASMGMIVLSAEQPRVAAVRCAQCAALPLVAVLAAEVTLRALARARDVGTLSPHQDAAPPPGEAVALGQMLRVSTEPRIVYELIPGLDVRFRGAAVTTNVRGFRGPEPAGPPTERTRRIVGIGDSVMFGWRVGDEEPYLAVLARRLREARPELDWQTVNTAVPGYNTVMQVETLKKHALDLEPDLVLVGFVNNDLDLPAFVRRKPDYLSLRRSFLRDFLNNVMTSGHRGTTLISTPFDDETWGHINDPQVVRSEYAQMIGFGPFEDALRELCALSESHDFRILVVSHDELPAYVRDTCESMGLPFVESADARRDYLLHTNTPESAAALQFSDKDPHPTALAHEITAGVILERLLADEVLVER
ncbi:MAG: SGNH/GDSL hydrolase family protein [bacterium]|nr:SGNH/GDSL hydrolase family protein [bacterium]